MCTTKHKIFANVWYSDYVLIINPLNGAVESFVNFDGLLHDDERTGDEDVLNGIAYNPHINRFYFTGKQWGKMFEIEIDMDGGRFENEL